MRYISDANVVQFEEIGKIFIVPLQEGTCNTSDKSDSDLPILEWFPDRRSFGISSIASYESAGREEDSQGRVISPKTDRCRGLFGAYDVGQVTFLILVTDVSVAADDLPYYGTIFRVTGLRLIELPTAHLSPKLGPKSGSGSTRRDIFDADTIQQYRDIFNKFCDTRLGGGSALFTCYDANLVLNFCNSASSCCLRSTFDDMHRDPIFKWNGAVCTKAFEGNHRFVPPIIRGFVGKEIISFPHKSSVLSAALICRLSVRRAGTRYNRRGIDHNGYVANFSETEQLLWGNGRASSFLSIRGSIPVVWSQHSDLRIVPKLEMPEEGDPDDIGRHMRILTKLYDESGYSHFIFLNLLGSRSHEQKLSDRYSSSVSAHNKEVEKVTTKHANVALVHFDLSKMLKKVKASSTSDPFEAASFELLNKVKEYLPLNTCAFKVTTWQLEGDSKGVIESKQDAILRINCLDCLDRSNIAQCIINVRALRQQLLSILCGGSDSHKGSAPEKDFEDVFSQISSKVRVLWSHHGDQLSYLYTGTVAHGSSILLPSASGNWLSLTTASIRWFHNNFFDGPKQDVITLVSGDHAPSPKRIEKPLRKGIPTNIASVGIVYGLCLLAIFVNTVALLANGYSFETWLGIVFAWFIVLIVLFALTVTKGGRAISVAPVLLENRHYY